MKQHQPTLPAPFAGLSAAPPWFEAMQRQFSEALLTPLHCDAGEFRVAPEAGNALCELLSEPAPGPHDARAAGATLSERVELYQRQYWMRLFGSLQEQLPRTALHVGYFHFNRLALHYLSRNPPDSFDLADVARGFALHLRHLLDAPIDPLASRNESVESAGLMALKAPRELLSQALRFDEAERRAFNAAWFKPWQPSRAELERLDEARLRVAPSFTLLREDWPLAALPEGSPTQRDSATPLEKLPQPRYWVCYRAELSVALQPVEAAFARLLHAVRTHPFGQAVALLGERFEVNGKSKLEQHLPAWTQTALQHSWWLGIE